jgi:hypothetical protein
MARPLLCLAFLCALAAESASANTKDCGGNAFTFAEVVEGRRAARRPIVSTPESLCADLIEDRPPTMDSLSLTIGDPSAAAPRRQTGPVLPGQQRRTRE